MKTINRKFTRFRKGFTRAIDHSPTPSPAATVHNSNPNINVQYGLDERFERAIDHSPAPSPAPIIHNNNANTNIQYGSGTIVNNNSIANYTVQASTQDEKAAIQVKITAVLRTRHVPEAVYDAQFGSGCMEGTRVQVLRDILIWVKDLKGPLIFWLTGMAGTGKTAIAWTICSRAVADAEIILGGSFFCSRSAGSAAQRDVRCVVPTLAQLLARQSSDFSKALADELVRDPDVLHKRAKAQIEQLIYKPLLAVKNSLVPILFVIDALDECSGQQSANGMADDVESHRIVSEMLEALVDLARSSVKLPIKFLVTSRPETHIRDTSVSDSSLNTILRLHTVNKVQVSADIQLYISTRLLSSPQLRARFTGADADTLTPLCDGLFIVAATALEYTLGASIDAAPVRFQTLLNASRGGLSTRAAAPLDHMYALILLEASRAEEHEMNELQTMLHLLGALLSSRMALSISALADLLDQPKDLIRARLSYLHAVVHVPEDNDEPSLRTLHASFGDYLFSRAVGHLRISESLGHEVLARGCLHRIAQDDLCFNVSRSRSSFELNPTTALDWFPLPLIYACLHWAHHIDSSSDHSAFSLDINRIFRPKFLFWLEVLSVLGKIGLASGLLRVASSVVDEPVVSQFLRDANAFVASSHEAISKSAPHIYLSALPFAAKDSLVYLDFAPLCTGVVSVTTLGVDRRDSRLVATLTGHQRTVNSVTYSPDGHLLASGSDDGTVRIWDTRTGEELISPLQNGDGPVHSVAFAPNGQCVASGSHSGEVHVWSVSTGRAALPPLRGHSSSVLSVAYSPDGALIASASCDATIRLWRAETGLGISLLTGHTGWVNAIAFSPDGCLLASASKDGTIRTWSHIGDPIDDPIIHPGGQASCLSFSHDGKWLAGGSASGVFRFWDLATRKPNAVVIQSNLLVQSLASSPDGSMLVVSGHYIRCWDPRSGEELSRTLFSGHSSWVMSVVFSPDGRFLASGSADCSVRIWDTLSGHESALQSMQAHNAAVLSVAAPLNGTVFASASEDCSVRVWDVLTGQEKIRPLLGHTNHVNAVATAPQGHLIASASDDCTIRLWDSQTGDPVGEPLRGHLDFATAVAFSPDARWLASGSLDKTVQVWEISTGTATAFSPLRCPESIESVAFSPDGRLLTAVGDSGYIYAWRSGTDQPAWKPFPANASGLNRLVFTADSKRIVNCGMDTVILVWDIVDHCEDMFLAGHDGDVKSVACSTDDWYIVSGSTDGTIRLWDAQTGESIAIIPKHGHVVTSVTFTPDGRSIISANSDATIRIWDVDAAILLSKQAEHDPLARLGSATLTDDGWLIGTSDELLLWVPEQDRGHIKLPPCSMLIASHYCLLAADSVTGGLHWGDRWTECWRDATVHSFTFPVTTNEERRDEDKGVCRRGLPRRAADVTRGYTTTQRKGAESRGS